DRAQQRGLAAARGAEEGDELAALGLHRHPVEHPVRAIGDAGLGNLERNRGRGHKSPSSTSSARSESGVVKRIAWMPNCRAAAALASTSSIKTARSGSMPKRSISAS